MARTLSVDVSEDGLIFQVQEYVEGEALSRILDGGRWLPGGEVARLGAVLAEALAEAHKAGVVHRDLKPGNVMLTTAEPGLKLARRGAEERAMQVARVRLRLGSETEAALERKRRAVVNTGLLFAALNYKAVLACGYALVRDNSRAPVALAARARKLPLFTIQFSDGEVTASPARPRAPRRSKTKPADTEQERLL